MKAPHASCNECPFQNRTFVPGTGHREQPDIALVGEAPGYYEAKEGKPFVGRSGELLQRSLDRLGIKPTIYVTNAALCWPPENKIQQAALRCCRPRLVAELQAVNPKLVVALGNSALNMLVGRTGEGIGKRRGRFYEAPDLDCEVAATYHPAAILRNVNHFPSFIGDLERFVKPPETDLRYPVGPTEITVMDRLADVGWLLDCIELNNYLRGDTWVLDVETTGLDPFRDKLLCVVLASSKDKVVIIPDTILYHPYFSGMLQSTSGAKWIGHNSKFDQRFLLAQIGVFIPFYFDTMLAHYCFDERSGEPIRSLKQLAAEYFMAPDWEAELRRHLPPKRRNQPPPNYGDIPREHLYRYAAFDGVYNWRLFQHFQQMLKQDETLKMLFFNTLMPLSNTLAEIEHRGILVDEERRQEIDAEYTKLVEERAADVRRLAGKLDLNPNSTQQLAVVLFDELGFPEIDGRSTAEHVLVTLKDRHPLVPAILSYRAVNKAYGTYIRPLPDLYDPNGIIHTTFNITGTVTGRLSSKNPNLQNQPREALDVG